MSQTEEKGVPGRLKWGACGMMLAATVICYMDRQVMGVAAPVIREQFHLTKEEMGYVLAAFFWAYALFQTPAGWLLDRGRTVLGYALAVTVWSIAGMLTAFARTIPTFQVCRGLLGTAESANWPAAMVLVRRMFPPSDRALANGLFTSGSGIGAIVTPPLVALLLAHGGWRTPFLLLGALGLVWAAAWLALFRTTPLRAYMAPLSATEKRPRTDWRAIFGSRLFYALILMSLTMNSYWHFIVNWLPTYLVEERGMALLQMGFAAMIPFAGQDVGNWLGGFVARSVAKRWSVEAGRRTAITIGALCAMMIWATAPAPNAVLCLAVLFISTMGQGMFAGNYLAYCQDVCPRDTGTVAGILGGLGGLAGAFVIPHAGRIADQTHSFAAVFVMLATFPLITLFALHVLKGPPKATAEGDTPA